MTKENHPALILIDIQKGFEDIAYWGGQRNNPEAENNAGKLLKFWRTQGLPVFHVKHCSTNPASPLAEGKVTNELMDVVKPVSNEPVIRKSVNSAFINTNLKEQLDKRGIREVVIVGLTTDHCVSTTTRMAGNLGYNTFVVSDATATFNKIGPDGQKYSAEVIHETALASLHNEFATVVSTDTIMNQLK